MNKDELRIRIIPEDGQVLIETHTDGIVKCKEVQEDALLDCIKNSTMRDYVKLHQLPTSPGAAQAQLSYKRDGQAGQQAQNTAPTAMPQTQQQALRQPSQQPQQVQQPLPFTTRQVCQYVVVSVSNQQDMSGQPLVCAVLQNAEGKQAKVYAQGSHPMLMPGAQLYDAQITMRKQGNVAFYTLDGYQVVQRAA